MRVNPTVRGLAIVVLVAALVTALQLEDVLEALFLVLRIVFVAVIAYVLYRFWRERREEIGTWSARARLVFYAAAALALGNVVVAFALDYPSGGLEALVFFAVLAASAFAMWRVWRDEHGGQVLH